MAQTYFSFFVWNAAYSYSKWDVVQGAVAGDTRYYYSTTDGNAGAKPTAPFYYTPTTTVRTDEIMRTSFTQTGTSYFQPGSIVIVSGVTPDSTANYTGVCLAAGPGYVEYLNPGLNSTNAVTNGVVCAPVHPYWTTGFYWVPSYSTDLNNRAAVMSAGMGEGYSQRTNPVINANTLGWGLVFENRSDKEARSLMTFLQTMGSASAFRIAFPVGRLMNTPNLQFVAGQIKTPLQSYNNNTVSFEAQQVFDL